MMNVRCPKCANPFSVDETKSIGMETCPTCGLQLCIALPDTSKPVPTPALASEPPQRTSNEPTSTVEHAPLPLPDDGDPGFEVVEESEPAPASLPVPIPEPASGFEVVEETQPVKVSPPAKVLVDSPDALDFRTKDFDPPAPEEGPSPRKKKKRKKKPAVATSSPLLNALLGMLLLGIGTASFLAGVFIYPWQRTERQQATADPVAALDKIKKLGGRVEYDKKDPTVVVSIDLSDTDVANLDLDALSAFPHLKRLNLLRTKINNEGLEFLENLTELENLNLRRTNLKGDGGLTYLRKLVNLKELDLGHTLVSDSGLEHLRKLPKLQKLSVEESNASGRNLESSMPNLKVSR